MINLYSTKRVTKKTYNPFSRFVLIGNNIDGFVNVGIIEFENFEVLKTRLPNIIKNLNFAGEWDLKLYQIPDQLQIKQLYGYYKVPKIGKLILEYSYMNADQKIEVLINNCLIHIFSSSDLNFDLKDEETGIIKMGSVMEEYITVLLYQESTKNSYVSEIREIENENYFKLKNSTGQAPLVNFSFD